jgi:hemin uptake protein HemP
MSQDDTTTAPVAATPSGIASRPLMPRFPVVPLSQLLGSRRELHIEHAGELYRLRITQANKLILTK